MAVGRAGPESEGFEAYHRLYGLAADVDRTEGRFGAAVRVLHVPRMQVFERQVSGLQHGRTTARARRDGFDHFALHMLKSGELVAGPAGAERRLKPGEVSIVDTSHPHRSRMEGAHLYTVQLAREHVQAVLGTVDRIHGAVLNAATAGLLADFTASLIRHDRQPCPGETDHAARAVTELLALSLSGETASPRRLSVDSEKILRRSQADAFIAKHLPDPRLNVDAVAAGIGVSRSVLYRIFEDEGGVRQFIQRHRLDAARRTLRRPGEGLSIAVLANTCGFASQSHFSRAFAGAFAISPGRFRAELRDARAADSVDSALLDNPLMRWAYDLY
ncbi:helix-turn-helix domain-containing protein [Methylobacterium goesingense]